MSLSYPMRWKPNIRAHSWKPNERIDHHTGRKPKLSPNKEWEKKECTRILDRLWEEQESRVEVGYSGIHKFCFSLSLSLSLSLSRNFSLFRKNSRLSNFFWWTKNIIKRGKKLHKHTSPTLNNKNKRTGLLPILKEPKKLHAKDHFAREWEARLHNLGTQQTKTLGEDAKRTR